jgi:hypothetical protein
MGGGYGVRTPGCIGPGPYNWSAIRTSRTIRPVVYGVRNGASGTTGPIAPGEIISIFANGFLNPIGPIPGVGLQLDQNGNVT